MFNKKCGHLGKTHINMQTVNLNFTKNSREFFDKLDVNPQRDDDASPMSTYRWDLLECEFQLFSTSQIQFRTFLKKNQIFGSHVVVLEDLSVDVSITYVGLILTKPGRFLFSAYGNSGYGQNSISSISNFLKKNSHFWVFMVKYSWRPFHWCINYECRTDIDEAKVI